MGWSEWKNLGASFDLLWENENPTSKFYAQTISLDLTKYEAVMICVIPHMNGKMNAWSTAVYCEKGRKCAIPKFYSSSGGSREVEVTEDGVVISAECSGTAITDTEQATCIPVRIYGISDKFDIVIDS